LSPLTNPNPHADASSIKKARPTDAPAPIFAVKFIHKAYSIRNGRISAKQLNLEITLHKHLGQHPNIVQFFQSGEDDTWKWIAMELAEGGDLFDKIESDVGVGEDIAHLYFTQLVGAVAYMHSKGVGHRDIKPENILLSAEGNLKIADFGLATLFSYQGQRKVCKTSCGSPPYTAPEVVTCDSLAAKKSVAGYYGDLVDIWSCGVVLFVLLAGNTPWDEPLERSYEFREYLESGGKPDDELWHKLPTEPLSLLRGMMKVDPAARLSLDEVRRHPWATRPNPYLGPDGKLINSLALATQMFENMRIDFSRDPFASQPQTAASASDDAMDLDSQPGPFSALSSTQPETATHDITFDWEAPPPIAASQPLSSHTATGSRLGRADSFPDRLAADPSFSQFSATPSVPLTTTQYARHFRDILPAHTLTRFFSVWAFPALLPALAGALFRLNVVVGAVAPAALEGREQTAWLKVKTMDGRHCPLSGVVVAEVLQGEGGLVQVTLVKVKGDPVEWRRFFKRLVVLCQDAVYKPE
jgi:serine/threonine-protein kinase Chk1